MEIVPKATTAAATESFIQKHTSIERSKVLSHVMFPEKFLLQNIVRTTAVALLTGEGTFKKTSANKVLSIDDTSTKRHNELYSEVWKRFSQSSTDVPALPPHAMLPRQARGTLKK